MNAITTLRARTRIELPDPPRQLDRLCEGLGDYGATVRREEGLAWISHRLGRAMLTTEGRALRLDVSSEDAASLSMLRGLLAWYVENLEEGLKPDFAWAGDGCDTAQLPYFRAMRVVSNAAVTPHMRRIRLAGPDLGRFAVGGMHLRLLIPPPGVLDPEWPVAGPNGAPVWPQGPRAAIPRVYTNRRIGPAAAWMEVDMVVHGEDEGDDEAGSGPGSRWALGAAPGDPVGILGPGGGEGPVADWVVLAGDETALPAIGRILEELPSDARGVAIVEVADAREEQDLLHPPGVALRWLHRNGLPAGTPNLLPAALRALHWPESGTAAAWAAAEFQVAQSMRCHLRDERGLDKDRCYCAAYWRQERG